MTTPVSLVCIVHSADVTPARTDAPFSPEILQQAMSCIRSFYHSCLAGGPEFSANICVLLADPWTGCRCVYQQFLPSTSHPISEACTSMYTTKRRNPIGVQKTETGGDSRSDAGEKEMAREGRGGASGSSGAEEATLDHSLWHTRSWSWVASRVEEGLQAGRGFRSPEPFGNGRKRTEMTGDASSSSTTSVPPTSLPADGWGCLAGALLTTCGILAQQQRAHHQAHGGFSSPPPTSTAVSSSSMHRSSSSSSSSSFTMPMEREGEETTAGPTARSPPHRAVIVVLSEEGRETPPMGTGASSSSPPSQGGPAGEGGTCTMATECGFAVAATTLAKRHSTTLHCFGKPFTAATTPTTTSLSSPQASMACRTSTAAAPPVAVGGAGAERVRGLVHSLGGITGETFSAGLWGFLLCAFPWRSLVGEGGRKAGRPATPPLLVSLPMRAPHQVGEGPVDPPASGRLEEDGVLASPDAVAGPSPSPFTSAAQDRWRATMQWNDLRAYGGREERADERLAHHYVVAPITLSPEGYMEMRLREEGEAEREAERENTDGPVRRNPAASDGVPSSALSRHKPEAERIANGCLHRRGGSVGTHPLASGYTVWLCPRCMSTVSPTTSIPTPHTRSHPPVGGRRLGGSGNENEADTCHRPLNAEMTAASHPFSVSSGAGKKRLREGIKGLDGPPNGFASRGNSKRTSPLLCCFCGA